MKISFIIPTYNRFAAIGRCLQSISRQIDTDFSLEVIVIDDGTDDTGSLVKSFYRNSGLAVHYIKQSPRLGLNKSRNVGLSVSTGDLAILLDSDNILIDGAVQKIIKITTHQKSDVTFFKSKTMSGRTFRAASLKGGVLYEEYISRLPIGEYLPVLTREFILKGNRFDEDVWGFEGLLWGKALKSGYIIFYSDEEVQIYDDLSDDRLSSVSKTQCRNRAVGMNNFLKNFGEDLARLNWSFYRRSVNNYYFYYKISNLRRDDFEVDLREHLRKIYGSKYKILIKTPSIILSCIMPLLRFIRMRF